MGTPTFWVEYLDPETTRKVDVTVAFHSNWHTVENASATAEKLGRFVDVLTRAMAAADVELSDFEGPDNG